MDMARPMPPWGSAVQLLRVHPAAGLYAMLASRPPAPHTAPVLDPATMSPQHVQQVCGLVGGCRSVRGSCSADNQSLGWCLLVAVRILAADANCGMQCPHFPPQTPPVVRISPPMPPWDSAVQLLQLQPVLGLRVLLAMLWWEDSHTALMPEPATMSTQLVRQVCQSIHPIWCGCWLRQ